MAKTAIQAFLDKVGIEDNVTTAIKSYPIVQHQLLNQMLAQLIGFKFLPSYKFRAESGQEIEIEDQWESPLGLKMPWLPNWASDLCLALRVGQYLPNTIKLGVYWWNEEDPFPKKSYQGDYVCVVKTPNQTYQQSARHPAASLVSLTIKVLKEIDYASQN